MNKIKVELKDLKKAVEWIESNGSQLFIWVEVDGNQFIMTTFDRQEKEAKIVLFSDGIMLPKITRTEVL